ncbi:MAG: cell division topological specificity factor MinE [Clostridiales bacterium]|nr:cell division topological specificity factor MinE [Clostridiales bacterium]
MDVFNILWKRNPSKKVAKDRLKLVLVNDRADSSPQVLEKLRLDIINTISSYMEIDLEDMDVQITKSPNADERGSNMPVLYANIPIKSLHRLRDQVSKKAEE